jgi:predicted RNA-binding Zn-ribbon protein involved in translation (DUF1610 family)
MSQSAICIEGKTMARARRKQGREPIQGEAAPRGKATPEVCPLCGTTREAITLPDDMAAHLQRHAPVGRCPHCGDQHTGWKVDWDGVSYPRQDVSLFYCSPCGRYAPVNTQEEGS